MGNGGLFATEHHDADSTNTLYLFVQPENGCICQRHGSSPFVNKEWRRKVGGGWRMEKALLPSSFFTSSSARDLLGVIFALSREPRQLRGERLRSVSPAPPR